jgi:peptide/nickel transport system permease protein
MGLTFGYMISGAITVEIVFAYPGIGLYAYNAFLNLDYAPIAAFALVVAILFSAVNLAVDLLYPIVDPQIRLE